VRESHGSTLKQLMQTNNQEAAPLSFQAFSTLLRLALAHMQKGDVPSVYNHGAFCQRIRPPRNIVSMHEAGVPHAIAATIPRRPSRGKYTPVSKGKVHQSFTHTYLF
jgi:hypothetical protein